jgi:uncharacterized protein YjiS (DUF1127 family)
MMAEWSDVYVTLREREETAAKPALAHWRLFLRRLATRRALRELDAHLLRDIGLSREQALAEAERPFWRLLVQKR